MRKFEFSTIVNKILCGKFVDKNHAQLKTCLFVENFFEMHPESQVINIKIKHKYTEKLTCNNY